VSEAPITVEAVQAAAARIAGHVHRTPVMRSRTFDTLSGRRIWFKCECLQRTGSFKVRGALNAVLRLPPEVARRGVVTHSSGNHAQALALAARLRGVPAHVVMPSDATPAKWRAVESYGGRITFCEPTMAARQATAAAVQARTGAVLIPPFDHPDVVAGQGTVALELLAQIDDLDAIVVPVGGGGLVSGVAIVVRALRPDVRVIGAEPAGADDAARSKAAGRLLPVGEPRTIADGLRAGLGRLTWPIVRDLVDAVVTVDDRAIVQAMRLVWERVKLVVEPSAAVPVAAVLGPAVRDLVPADATVAVVLSGGNVDLDRIDWSIGR
jgi:Threonine dehydratase